MLAAARLRVAPRRSRGAKNTSTVSPKMAVTWLKPLGESERVDSSPGIPTSAVSIASRRRGRERHRGHAEWLQA
jgi:hypothetical protein